MATLTAVRGDTFTYSGTVTSNGAALDLTGGTLWFTMKTSASLGDTDAATKLYWVDGGSASGIAVASPATGAFTVTVAAATTTSWLPETTYVYDVQLQTGTGRIVTVDSGTVQVRGDVTRRTTTP